MADVFRVLLVQELRDSGWRVRSHYSSHVDVWTHRAIAPNGVELCWRDSEDGAWNDAICFGEAIMAIN